jgi:hypothetical protein
MSAFLCSMHHLCGLVSFGHAHQVAVIHGTNCWRLDDRLTCEIAGEILYQANVLSLIARYGAEAAEEDARDVPWSFEMMAPEDLPTPGSIANACDCYDYQANEADSYDGSIAQAIVNAIRQSAAKLPTTHHDTPWEL